MRILLTNDDGIHAEGLVSLERIARTLSDDVWVVAPETDQSGYAHSLSISEPLRLRRIGEKHFAVRGTPTDCVIMGARKILPDLPDLILSGVNSGANVADDVTYSGTVAGAMEGALLGVRSIALSQSYSYVGEDRIVPYATAETLAPALLERLIATPLPQAKAEIRARMERLTPAARPGDFAQGLMDLGATVCTPKRPRCMLCPLVEKCSALTAGDPEFYPVRPAKAEKPLRRGAAFVAVRADGAILLRKRPDKGLLGGMSEVPTTGWTSRIDGETEPDSAPFAGNWQRVGSINHVFTHFSLELDVFKTEMGNTAPAGTFWSLPRDISGEALPTVMKKAIEAAIPGATKKTLKRPA